MLNLIYPSAVHKITVNGRTLLICACANVEFSSYYHCYTVVIVCAIVILLFYIVLIIFFSIVTQKNIKNYNYLLQNYWTRCSNFSTIYKIGVINFISFRFPIRNDLKKLIARHLIFNYIFVWRIIWWAYSRTKPKMRSDKREE